MVHYWSTGAILTDNSTRMQFYWVKFIALNTDLLLLVKLNVTKQTDINVTSCTVHTM